ncbi:hypothetical protein VNO77_15822 [Canavalia gladiata]|uniref:Uncharacterized protein n=1 Tax=Canavalia gladiata TaxID=3824 RepID=A0AAN9QPD5_CANGL
MLIATLSCVCKWFDDLPKRVLWMQKGGLFNKDSSAEFSSGLRHQMLEGCFINEGDQLHQTEICPYCKAKLWSMLQANMIPQSANFRLGSYEDCIRYYVWLNGHLLGVCSLLPLSDSEYAPEK